MGPISAHICPVRVAQSVTVVQSSVCCCAGCELQVLSLRFMDQAGHSSGPIDAADGGGGSRLRLHFWATVVHFLATCLHVGGFQLETPVQLAGPQ